VSDASLRKAYKYKLKPTAEQERELERVLWLCRTLYNTALEQRITAYQRCGVTLTCYQQQAELPDLKAVFPEYAAIHSLVLQDVLSRLDKTYQAFFCRIKAGQTPGFPRYQGRNRYHSVTYKQYGNGVTLDNGFLILSKIGRVAVRWSRPEGPWQGTPKTVAIAKEADGWYAIVSCADVPAQPLPTTGRETGIDVGLKVFLITADGEVVENPHLHRRGEKKIAKAQRVVSRRKKGGHGRRKAVGLLQRAHQHIKRQRADFQHKTALKLLRQYDTIYLEDLQVANMVRNRHLAKSISDAGWAQFCTILAAKAACAGRRVVAVPPAYTSQDCSSCGVRIPKSLSVRTHICTNCGLVLDRDENAARNIQWAGQALRGLAGWPAGANRVSAMALADAECQSQVLQDVVLRVDRAFQAFFRRVRAGETPGYPRFHGRDRYNSFTYPQVSTHGGAHLDNGFLVLSKIGRVVVRWSRPLEGTPKTVTISREADGWYVSISCAKVPMQALEPTGLETGIDLGIESFATLADGAMIHNPQCYRRVERRLKTAQRKVSRRKKGSNRRHKAIKLLAKAHQRVKRQRADFQHKTALQLVRQFDVIYHEDLQVANMVKNHHLAKSIQDAGWRGFLTILTFKAACAGKRVVAVNPAYTSQMCSGCGVVVTKGLSVRWHSCPECGTSLHRDHNAAMNILQFGQRRQESAVGQTVQALTQTDGSYVA
jgi:putative transposase